MRWTLFSALDPLAPERPPPVQLAYQEVLTAAEWSAEYLS